MTGPLEPITIVELRPQRIAAVRRTVPQSGLGAFFGEVMPRIFGMLAAQGARPAGATLARYFNNDPTAFDTEAGIPFDGAFTGAGEVHVAELPGGSAAMTLHIGTYETLSAEYKRIMAWAESMGIPLGRDPWEVYVSDPEVDGDKTRTEVYFPLA